MSEKDFGRDAQIFKMVFSGIIETTGTIVEFHPKGPTGTDGLTLVIRPLAVGFMNHDVSLGCSIAVNGTCLTVTKFDSSTFQVDLAPETLRKTSFASLERGAIVNLERALKSNDRNSGHTVQGHVDGTGVIGSITRDGVSLWVRISTSHLSHCSSERSYLNSLIVPKGFIAIDGASLTVCEVNRHEEWFTLMLIPHTQEVLKPWLGGGVVNIELDCLAKYVASTVRGFVDPQMRRFERDLKRTRSMCAISMAVSVALCCLIAFRK